VGDFTPPHGIQSHFIEPGKPNRNAYVESFNGRLCDECLRVAEQVAILSRSHVPHLGELTRKMSRSLYGAA
jgi:transposase InsO family protein